MKDARLELRIDPDLKRRVEVEAGRRGQKITTFVERALESALSSGATGVASRGLLQDGVAPLASTRASEPVRSSQELALDRQRRLNKPKG